MEHVSHQDYESDVVFVVNTKTQDRRTAIPERYTQHRDRPDPTAPRTAHPTRISHCAALLAGCAALLAAAAAAAATKSSAVRWPCK